MQQRLDHKKELIFDRKKEEGQIVASEGWRYPRQGPKKLVHLPEEVEVFLIELFDTGYMEWDEILLLHQISSITIQLSLFLHRLPPQQISKYYE